MLTGVALALLTSLSWAVANVFIQKTGHAIGAVRSLAWALLFGAVATGALGRVVDRPLPSPDVHVGWAFALSIVFGLLGYAGMFYAFAKARLSLSVPIVSSWSLVAGVVAFLFFGEQPRAVQLAGAGLVFCGVIVVSFGGARRSAPRAGDPSTGAGVAPLFAAFLGSVGFGVMIPMSARVAPVFGELTTSAMMFGGILALGLPTARALGLSIAPPPRPVLFAVLVTAVAETAGFVAIVLARRFAPMAVVGPIASLASAFTIVYAWFVLRERQSRTVVAGGALVCAGLVVLAL